MTDPNPSPYGDNSRTGWQPIETAPTPDEDDAATHWIIGYTSWGQHVGKFHWWVGPCEWINDHFEFANTDFDAFPRPTHWQAWPAPPAKATEPPR